MEIKCLKSFVGLVTGQKGRTLDVPENVANDLIGAGYAVKVAGAVIEEPPMETAKPKTRKKAKA